MDRIDYKILLKAKQGAMRELLGAEIADCRDLMLIKRVVAKKYSLPIFSNAEILKELSFKNPEFNFLKRLLRKRAVRTMSGIAPVAVLTKSYPCPGKCAYCPTEKDVPQSYLSNEPAVMRAIRCGYDPYIQVQDRLRALLANGHEPTKIELIVIGGTWSCLPVKYKYWYVLSLFAAANRFKISSSQSLNQFSIALPLEKIKKLLLIEQKKNEMTKYQIVGLTLETRPDFIDKKELEQMRELGCTRVELGVQHLDDAVLKLNKRGHGVKEIADATAILKNYGFKITYHIMPGLPGSTLTKDFRMYQKLFKDWRFQPDQIKFYPCVVTKGSLLYRWWKQGKYHSYSDKQLRDLIIKCKKATPEYARIIRLIRDIPGESIIAGNKITNLRQVMKDEGVECRCIRCREIKNNKDTAEGSHPLRDWKLTTVYYTASSGTEYFIQASTKDTDQLLGFCRLRITPAKRHYFSCAIIRELHVYGELVPIGKDKKIQHAGLGRILMSEAEKIAREAGCKKISVISGVGVRGYYRKLGYRLDGTYMRKKLE